MKKIKWAVITLFLTFLIMIIITNPNAKEGALNGICLCQNIIIPALLPILIITNIIIKTKCSLIFEKVFGKFTISVLHLPKCTTSAIILSLIGGYPLGAILINELYSNNRIGKYDAIRLMRFCFCGGCAFIITSVGTIFLKSTKIGILLYIINVIASILIATISSLFYPKIYRENDISSTYINFEDAMIKSVEIAVKSLMNMSAYIILFSCLINIVSIPKVLSPLFEITSGIFNSHNMSLNFICTFLSFGGFCIHLQIMPILKNIGMKYKDFLIFRIIASIISLILMNIYLRLFPQTVNVFSNITTLTPKMYEVNTTLSVIMVISSIVLILDLDEKNTTYLK